MAYKITKYKGKYKIKDTKSGKSVDIDIEKFMKGGKSTPKYNDGGCPEGMVWDAMTSECKPSQNMVWDAMTGQYKERPQYGIEDENSRRPVNTVSTLQPQGLAQIPGAEISTPDMSSISLKDTMNDMENPETSMSNNNDDIYNIPNPYAGVDIPTAAFTLGQSIENKSALGIVGSGLKLATGLGRNLVSGLGYQNRYNQVMQDYYKDQKNSKNPVQYFAYGGKKDEELATGEYMHGIMNPDTEEYNAEIEKGEYFQSNEGDIAEVVGDKHSEGGEKIQMETNDRVLSDKLKLGSKTAKMLSKKYDMKLKAKHTYSDVLDKFRKKSKLDKILEEEAELLKKIGEQEKVEDATTRNFNLEVLTKKVNEVASQKDPIEEERKEMFEELFNIQEESKPANEKSTDEFEFGGNFDALAAEYNVPVERAKEIIRNYAKGGKMVPKYEEGVKIGDIDPKTGKKVTEEVARQKVESGEWEALGSGRYVDRGTPGSQRVSGQALQSYRQTWDRERFPKFEDYVNAAEQWKRDNPDWNKSRVENIPGTPDEFFYTEPSSVSALQARDLVPLSVDTSITAPDIQLPVVTDNNQEELVIDEEAVRQRNNGLAGMYLFPDESPLPPSSLQGTIKPERRFDRVRSTEIDAEPYLQDIRDREAAQVQSLEGLSPNVRAAVLANMRANNQKAESDIRNQIDTQNLQSEERAIYTNAQIQAREENASEADRLAYEQRQYRAQALTDNDLNNYYNQLQAINKQRFMDIHNLNLINATNEDVYFDGQTYRRKNSDRDILRQIKI